ncbi:MAG: aspartate aminotransferase family protein [Oscillospiraceae bacterium]|nr:aspartate aminotransferase family protein [Oscillospiraceae bacterium]
MSTIEKFNSHVMHTYGRLPIVLDKGSASNATDENGMEYIDFGSGIGTNSLGYCDEKWADAVCAQVRTIQHTSNYFYTKVQADYAERLCTVTGYESVFFCNSGAEANECAIKIARKYSSDKYGEGRGTIITLTNSFHGRTITTLSATGQDVFHKYFFPFTPGFIHTPANDTAALEKAVAEDKSVCAVMVEFIQGEGGVNRLDPDFARDVQRICEANDLVFIADEVQTGMGRTGTMLASEQYGVKPDVTTLAKGIAGGIPMGACLARGKCSDVLTAGTHGSTFGGNPIACAGAAAVLDRLTSDGFLEEVQQKGYYFSQKLLDMKGVSGITGMGLMIGVIPEKADPHDVLEKAAKKGLLILTAKEKIRLLPPLTISREQIDKGLKILSDILSEV